MKANECQFSIRSMDVLMNTQCPHKLWSTLKSSVFVSSSSLPPLISVGGGLVCESVGKEIYCEIILIVSNRWTLQICHPPAINHPVRPPLHSDRLRLGNSFIIIIIKKGRQCKAEREVVHTLSVRRPQPHNTNL